MPAPGLFFRIVYNSIYVFLCLILAVLLLVVPGDFVQQALHTTHQVINVIVIAIVYVLTVIIILFVYALRLYVTRTVLASIPKARVPVEKGDARKEVRGMIADGLGRSASIAYEARPKELERAADVTDRAGAGAEGSDASPAARVKEGRRSLQVFRSRGPATAEHEIGIARPSVRPVWGEIEHYGWAPPPAPQDLSRIPYTTVFAELPHLIEATAVSQAPADPDARPDAPTFDAEAVALLQRAPHMTMRDYVTHLIGLGVLPSSQEAADFLDAYEQARFSTRPTSNADFKRLMHLFAQLLRDMQPLDASLFYGSQNPDDGYSESDGHVDDNAPLDTTPTTPARSVASSYGLGGGDSSSLHLSRRRRPSVPGGRNSSANTWQQYRTAPTTPKSRVERAAAAAAARPSSSAGSSGANTFAQTRQPYAASSYSSSRSSLGSFSQGSVIRLAASRDSGDMSYVLRLADTV
ncbi:sucrase/ferredoxin domain-containing protein [Xylariaceae sp. FL0804]|nr:sucrase/ferredoxin domain-containing protein [Xylariaceae sp. FL0804]